ncbi:MAG: flagellar basal-body rod protein FlgB [Rickettsiaceae bacterium]|jgi:flagellar basal-body rod protein FlgB|nr:flagellar basal-body rod protein FlgB [Rickettsiaceae bacterium]
MGLNINEIVKSLEYYSKNHEVLADNVMNANTPGRLAREIAPQKSFDSFVRSSVGLATTHNNHIQGKQTSIFKVIYQKDADEMKPNGNNISIPQQTQKIAANQLKYNTVTEAYMKANALWISALGRSGQ